MSCAHWSMAVACSHKEGVILALGIALRAPVKTCWKATQYLPPSLPAPCRAFLRPASNRRQALALYKGQTAMQSYLQDSINGRLGIMLTGLHAPFATVRGPALGAESAPLHERAFS